MASRNVLPLEFLRKTGIYDVQIDGDTIKTRVADNAAVVHIGITELKTELATMNTTPPIVGLDVKCCGSLDRRACLLILMTRSLCLIVQFKHLDTAPLFLPGFLDHSSILFVGANIIHKIRISETSYSPVRKVNHGYEAAFECKRGVDVGDLAARVLKKPNLVKSSLPDIAREIGILDEVKPDLSAPSGSGTSSSDSPPDWSAMFFTPEEVNVAIEEANLAYKVGKKAI